MSWRGRSITSVVEMLEQRTLFAAGDVDFGFSTDGVVTTNFSGGYDNARAVAVQKDGKIIVAGEAGSLGFAAVRYNADGTLDDGSPNDSTPGDHFGINGKFTYAQDSNSGATAIAIQKDGKIILAGTAYDSQQYWLLLRLNPDGSFDKTFGVSHNGKAVLKFSIFDTPLTGIALQSDGKAVVCGSANGAFLVGRFDTKGVPDETFNGGGTAAVDFGGTDTASGVVVDGLGNIVVAGGVGGDGLHQNIGLARFQSNGTLDSNFDQDGKVTINHQLARLDVTGLTITSDAELHVAISEFDTGFSQWQAIIIGVTYDGRANGSETSTNSKVNAFVTAPNGHYLLAMTSADTPSTRLQVSFNGLTIKTPYIGISSSGATAIATAPDGSVFEAGFADRSGGRDFLLVKLNGIDPKTWGTVSGNVFRDTDGDTVRDPNEKGNARIRVFIDLDKDGIWDSAHDDEPYTWTDINGNFVIKTSELGDKVLREVVPGGSTQDFPPSPGWYTVSVKGGGTTKGVLFANKPIAVNSTQTAIVGSVFNDWNGNAQRDISYVNKPSEPDLAKITVFIDSNKNGRLDGKEIKTTTDAGGNYALNLAKGGAYRVAVVLPNGWINTTPAFFDVNVHVNNQVTERFGLAFADNNDTITEATALPPITPGSNILGTLGNAVDVNVYRFTARSNQRIAFDLDLIGGSSLDSYLRLYDSKGKLLATNDNAAALGEGASIESYLSFKFAKAGTYFIAVSDHLNKTYNIINGNDDIGGGTFGKYSLNVTAG